MSKTRAKDEILGQLHEALAKHLLDKVRTGEASAQELGAAIKFLANNGIEAESVPDSTIGKLAQALPEFNDDDNEEPLRH